MKQNKYLNGMYKGTSKLQDRVASGIFTSLQEICPSLNMGQDLEQITGDCTYFFYFNGQILKVRINQDGVVIGKFYSKG